MRGLDKFPMSIFRLDARSWILHHVRIILQILIVPCRAKKRNSRSKGLGGDPVQLYISLLPVNLILQDSTTSVDNFIVFKRSAHEHQKKNLYIGFILYALNFLPM